MIELGTSDFAAAAGLHPHNSRIALWRVLTGRREREVFNPEWIANGVRDEAWAVAKAEEMAGIKFKRTGKEQISVRCGRFRSTPDGIASISCPTYPMFPGNVGPDGQYKATTGLEVKSPQHRMYEEVPSYYLPQVQGQCYVCGFVRVLFCAAMGSHVRAWWVSRSEDYIEAMMPLIEDFLVCLDHDIEPPKLTRRPEMPSVEILEIPPISAKELELAERGV